MYAMIDVTNAWEERTQELHFRGNNQAARRFINTCLKNQKIKRTTKKEYPKIVGHSKRCNTKAMWTPQENTKGNGRDHWNETTDLGGSPRGLNARKQTKPKHWHTICKSWNIKIKGESAKEARGK